MVSLVKTNLLILTEVMQHLFFLAIILCSSVHMYTMDQLLAILGQLAQMLVNLQTRTFTALRRKRPIFSSSCGLPPSLPPSHPPSSEHIRESIKIPLLPLMISSLSCKRFFLPYKSPQLTWAAFCIFLTLPNTVFHVLRKLARLRIKQGRHLLNQLPGKQPITA